MGRKSKKSLDEQIVVGKEVLAPSVESELKDTPEEIIKVVVRKKDTEPKEEDQEIIPIGKSVVVAKEDGSNGIKTIGKVIAYNPSTKKYHVNGTCSTKNSFNSISTITPLSRTYFKHELKVINEK